ncbi:hypothetical protein [Kocuria nitroreducens]|uniref:hypothetical protein n=1 Tax=Kocuria nitroreducens TaxID=3058914 RepID=UPI0036DB9626
MTSRSTRAGCRSTMSARSPTSKQSSSATTLTIGPADDSGPSPPSAEIVRRAWASISAPSIGSRP